MRVTHSISIIRSETAEVPEFSLPVPFPIIMCFFVKLKKKTIIHIRVDRNLLLKPKLVPSLVFPTITIIGSRIKDHKYILSKPKT